MFSWRVLTIGHLSRNRFWGESEDTAYRYPLATSTLIQMDHLNIIVDPSQDNQNMATTLFNRSGLKPEDIDIVYFTHKHSDHWMDFEAFTNAQYFMAPIDLAELLSETEGEQLERIRRIKPAPDVIVPGIERIHLPGHTNGISGLLFYAPEGRVLISGDSIMTHEFFQAGIGYFYCVDAAQSKESILKAAQICDVVVPGHGNWFLTRAYLPQGIELK